LGNIFFGTRIKAVEFPMLLLRNIPCCSALSFAIFSGQASDSISFCAAHSDRAYVDTVHVAAQATPPAGTIVSVSVTLQMLAAHIFQVQCAKGRRRTVSRAAGRRGNGQA
jgi:hypothetical protein